MQKLLFNNNLSYRLTRHLLFILGIILCFSLILYYGGTQKNYGMALRVTILNSIFFLGYAYLTIFLLIPFILLKGNVGQFLALLLFTGLFLSALKFLVSGEVFYAAISPVYSSSANSGIFGKLLVNVKDMTFLVALLSVSKFTKDFVYTGRQLAELEVQNREARQQLLQSQLNPHFLYNTINNLYALSLLEPSQTLKVTKKIQKVLGYIVEQSQYNFLSLKKEVELVRNYISLEQLRYGNRLKARIIKKGNLEDWIVPPMLLFFMAENGIRHGSRADTGKPWLRILIDAQTDILFLEAINSKPQMYYNVDYEKNKGTGIQNMKKRLEILYPESSFKLEIDEDADFFCIRLGLNKLKNGLARKSYR
jgi:two-component system, LytTR family, sensor kinase